MLSKAAISRPVLTPRNYNRLAAEAGAEIRRERHRHDGTCAQEEQDQSHCVVAEMAAALCKRH